MANFDDQIDLKEILNKIKDYKKYLLINKFYILGLSITFAVFAFLLAINLDTKYKAELTFVVESDAGTSMSSLSGLASQFGFNLPSGGGDLVFSQNNIIELLKSRGIIVNTLMQRAEINGKVDLLIEHYIEINQLKKKWEEYNNIKDISFSDNIGYLHDSISGKIFDHIIEEKISVDIKSVDANIITLSYTSVDQYFAKKFVETLIDEMSRMYIQHKTAQANHTLEFISVRADSVFHELEIVEREFARTKDINQRIIKATGRLKELQLMRQVQVLNTMYLELIKNMELSKLTLLNETPIINIIDKPILPLEEEKLSEIIAILIGLFLGVILSCCYFVFKKLFFDALSSS